jgi:hypothetical protein
VLSLQPAVLAEQLYLIDPSLYSHMHVIEELQFASWISKERRQRTPYLTAMREFDGYISHWITSEILKEYMESSAPIQHSLLLRPSTPPAINTKWNE